MNPKIKFLGPYQTLGSYLSWLICIAVNAALFALALALKASNCEYLGSSCMPFSSMESMALCNALKFSCPWGGWTCEVPEKGE